MKSILFIYLVALNQVCYSQSDSSRGGYLSSITMNLHTLDDRTLFKDTLHNYRYVNARDTGFEYKWIFVKIIADHFKWVKSKSGKIYQKVKQSDTFRILDGRWRVEGWWEKQSAIFYLQGKYYKVNRVYVKSIGLQNKRYSLEVQDATNGKYTVIWQASGWSRLWIVPAVRKKTWVRYSYIY